MNQAVTHQPSDTQADEFLAAIPQQPVAASSEPASDKYDEVIKPFVALMVAELHANSGKGDRLGWLSMSPEVAMLEIYYHVAKLQKAAKDSNSDLIREYGADVANMAMMLVDVCGALSVDHPSTNQPVQAKVLTDDLYVLSMNEEAMEEAIQHFKGSSAGEALKAVFAAQKSLRALLASQPSAQPIEQRPVATLRVTNKGYGVDLSTYVAYALPEGLHDVYAMPQPSAPADVAAVRDAALDVQVILDEACKYFGFSQAKFKEDGTIVTAGVGQLIEFTHAIRALKSAAPPEEAA